MKQREYVQKIAGIDHTFLLTEEQAKDRGLTDADLVPVEEQADEGQADEEQAKERVPANKARQPRTK